MVTDPPAMPPPVIATALKEPLALTAPEAARAARRNNSSAGANNGASGSGASGSGNSVGTPAAPEIAALNASDGDAAPGPAQTTVPVGATSHPAATAATPWRQPEPDRDAADQAVPSPLPAAPASATASGTAAASGAAAAPAAGAPATSSAGVAAPLGLQDICCKLILRNISVHNCIELLGAVQGRQAPALETIAAASLRYVVTSFEMLQGLRSEEEMRAVLPAQVYDNLVSAQQERVKAVEEMRRLGRAMERQLPPADLGPVQVPSVTGRPTSYPPEALKSGLVWPEGVKASDRETWLSEADFRCLFKGLGWEEFCKLPAWKKTNYKQEAGMF